MLAIIIPVYNKWELTSACLHSIAQHAQGVQVLLVDNASTDATPQAAPILGQALFGSFFTYLPQVTNKNFAGACNLAAQATQADYLLFLNNDTLLTPTWSLPWQDLQTNPTLGAASPLLLYDFFNSLPDRVQHLGITFNPLHQLSHLYEFFPATHPVVQKTRSWQAITAAALFMPRSLFITLGCFDESFINGFEDVELCQRIIQSGHTLAVQPKSIIYHLASQTPGRHDATAHNANLLSQKSGNFFQPDKADLLAQDGYSLKLSIWATFDPYLSPEISAQLKAQLPNPSHANYIPTICNLLNQEPYWLQGYYLLVASNLTIAKPYLDLATSFWHNPDTLLPLANLAQQNQDLPLLRNCLQSLAPFFQDPTKRIKQLRRYRSLFRSIAPQFSQQADYLLTTEARFLNSIYEPNFNLYRSLAFIYANLTMSTSN